ncbi:MAG: hypothetical protein QM757_11420 [Paludibaculum sp.]
MITLANPGEFTGKERDSEAGLDYFGAGHLSSTQERWTSSDAVLVDQQHARPLLDSMHEWLQGTMSKLSRKSDVASENTLYAWPPARTLCGVNYSALSRILAELAQCVQYCRGVLA